MSMQQLSLFDDAEMKDVVEVPFLGRNVVVTGTFARGRQSLRSTLLKMGATEVRYDKLNRGTHFLLCGESPNEEVMSYWRMYVHDGYNIRLLHEDDLNEILRGNYAPYNMPQEMNKDLRITREHVFWTAPEIGGLKNTREPSPMLLQDMAVLYNKEIFVHPSFLKALPSLPQLLGCLGAYANTEMADDIDCILISRDLPEQVCRAVEQFYNGSRAMQFNTPFLLLDDLLAFIAKRMEDYPDEVLAPLWEELVRE